MKNLNQGYPILTQKWREKLMNCEHVTKQRGNPFWMQSMPRRKDRTISKACDKMISCLNLQPVMLNYTDRWV